MMTERQIEFNNTMNYLKNNNIQPIILYFFDYFKAGNVIQNIKTKEEYVVIDTHLNGDDNYYSWIEVISLKEYESNHCILKDKLKTIINIFNYQNDNEDYIMLNKKYIVKKEEIYTFGGKEND